MHATTLRPAGRGWMHNLRRVVPLIASAAITAIVAGVIITSGLKHRSLAGSARAAHGAVKPAGPSGPHARPVSFIVTRAPACRLFPGGYGRRTPALVKSQASPGSELTSMLGLLRDPTAASDLAALGPFGRYGAGVGILRIYTRYIRVFNGQRDTRVAFFPATVCNQTQTSKPRARPIRIRIAPLQALVMVVLSNPLPHGAILVGGAATIADGPADPGLDVPGGWLQATVVPDGVARVVMRFTPPFLHHYTVAMTIRDNVGIAVRNPDYFPTTVKWYAPNGHLIRTFVDRQDLRYENCLAKHKRNCH
jgi:hypothetical protein